jgi:hypothetical protein
LNHIHRYYFRIILVFVSLKVCPISDFFRPSPLVGVPATKLHLLSKARRLTLRQLAVVAVLYSLSYLTSAWHHGGLTDRGGVHASAAHVRGARFWLPKSEKVPEGTKILGYCGYRKIPAIFRTDYSNNF